jgi:hypothetical protein
MRTEREARAIRVYFHAPRWRRDRGLDQYVEFTYKAGDMQDFYVEATWKRVRNTYRSMRRRGIDPELARRWISELLFAAYMGKDGFNFVPSSEDVVAFA